MAYDNPMVVTYNWGVHDFGAAADEALSLKGPPGKKGKIIDVMVSATEIFTTGGDVLVGSTAGAADYVNFPLGTLADTDTLRASDTTGALVLVDLPADTQIEVTFTQTGGTPTGQGYVLAIIEWY